MAYFDITRILVITLEELSRNPMAVMKRVYSHIGVDANFRSPEFDVRLNSTSEKLLSASTDSKVLHELTQDPAAQGMAPRSVNPATSSTITSVRHEQLRCYFRADVQALRAITGRSFEHWNI